MGGRIDCRSCDDYITPDEVTVGKSLDCPACLEPREENNADSGTKEATPKGEENATAASKKVASQRIATMFSQPLPMPA